MLDDEVSRLGPLPAPRGVAGGERRGCAAPQRFVRIRILARAAEVQLVDPMGNDLEDAVLLGVMGAIDKAMQAEPDQSGTDALRYLVGILAAHFASTGARAEVEVVWEPLEAPMPTSVGVRETMTTQRPRRR